MLINNNVDIFNKLIKLKAYGYKYINEIDIIETNKVQLPNNLDNVIDIINNCNLCKLANIANNKTDSTGIKINDIVFISIQTINNDKYYQEFFNLVSRILDIKIKNIYILNVLKCEIKNIKNIDNELLICKDYIIKELDIIKPSLVVSLGDAYKYLNNKYESFEIGYINKLKYYDLLIIQHPYYVQQNPSLKDDFIQHIHKIKKYLEIH